MRSTQLYHIPLLRAGHPYESLDLLPVTNVVTGKPFVSISQASPGMIAKDLSLSAKAKKALGRFSVSELLAICKQASTLFMETDLPLDRHSQSPSDYVQQVSATTGLPEAISSKNMKKIGAVLEKMDTILSGLTRGLDLSILDSGWAVHENRPLSYLCETDTLGVVLPNNSPGVHTLWLPAIPLKVPVALKPGSHEPWTPYRVAQAFIRAGCPREAFGFYPADYPGATEILLRCGKSMLFGGESTVSPWRSDSRIQIHGPGRSKIIIGEDQISRWEDYLDVMVSSIVENSGRSCLNASGIWVPSHGRDIAMALTERLTSINVRPLHDPEAQLAAFPDPKFAERLNDLINDLMKAPGATDLTAQDRQRERLVRQNGCSFLMPTVVCCDKPEHPLANTEFLFPFVSIVEVPQSEMLNRIGPTLVSTAITDDEAFILELVGSPSIDRLNLGPIPTTQVSWDQPHEGNLFEHLYRQKALSVGSLV